MTKTLKDRVINFQNAAITFSITNISDVISSIYALNNGAKIDDEANPFARFLMHQVGPTPGILLTCGLFFPVYIGLAHICNKYMQKYVKKDSKFRFPNLGTFALYYQSALKIFATIYNFNEY